MFKDEFVMVGIGQGGGKLAKGFYDEKYRSFFINTSYDDLKALNVSEEFIYHVPAAKGCAKKREVAMEYAKNYYDQIVGKLLDTHPTGKVFIAHYTLGGGTGGGLSNFILAVLRNKLNESGKEDAVIIAVVAKPRNYEPWQVQTNALASLKELYNMVKVGVVNQYFIINNNARNALEDINEEHVMLLDRWIEGEGANNKSNADESERYDIMAGYHGGAVIFEFDSNDECTFKNSLEEAYNNSIYCIPSKNPQAIGIALNDCVPEDLAVEKIQEVVGYYPNSHITPTKVSNMIMLSGLIKNKNDKIENEITKIANEKGALINQGLAEENDTDENITLEEVSIISESKKDNNKKKINSINDILSLFE